MESRCGWRLAALVLVNLLVAALPPLSAAADPDLPDRKALTQRDFDEEQKQQMLVELADYSRFTSDSAELQTRVKAFFEAYVDRFFVEGFYEPREIEPLRAQAQKLMEDGCENPVFLHCYARILTDVYRYQDAKRILEVSAQRIPEKEYGNVHRFRLKSLQVEVARRLSDRSWENALATDLGDVAMAWLRDDAGPKNARLRYASLLRLMEFAPDQACSDLSAAIDQDMNLDPWLRHMIVGKNYHNEAWRVRGGGLLNTLSKQTWEDVQKLAGKAEEHFVAAWQINPNFPEAPGEMVLLQGIRPSNIQQIRMWFDRAVAAQFDYDPAYSKFLMFLHPRWFGNHEMMLRFGINRANSKRYETSVPSVLVDALLKIERDGGGNMWGNSEAYPKLRELFDGLQRETSLSATKRHWYRTWEIVAAIKAEQWEDARRALDAAADRPLYLFPFQTCQLDLTYTLSRVYALSGPAAKEMAAVDHVLMANQPMSLEAAQELHESLQSLEGTGGDPRAADYFRLWKARLEATVRVKQFQWWSPSFATEAKTWLTRVGSWNVVNEQEIVGTDSNRQPHLLLRYAGISLPPPIEIAFDAEVIEQPDAAPPKVGIFLGFDDEFLNSKWSSRARFIWVNHGSQSAGQNYTDMAPVKGFQPVNHFRIRWLGETLEVRINEQHVGTLQMPVEVPTEPLFALVVQRAPRGESDHCSVRFLNFRARGLPYGVAPLENQKRTAYYSSVLDHEATDLVARRFRADAYNQLSQFEKAAADFRQILKSEPNDAEAHAGLAEALAGLGQFGPASEEFKPAMKDSGNAKVRIRLAWVRAMYRHPSLNELPPANELIPPQSKAMDDEESRNLAQAAIEYDAGNYQRAQAILDQTKALLPNLRLPVEGWIEQLDRKLESRDGK